TGRKSRRSMLCNNSSFLIEIANLLPLVRGCRFLISPLFVLMHWMNLKHFYIYTVRSMFETLQFRLLINDCPVETEALHFSSAVRRFHRQLKCSSFFLLILFAISQLQGHANRLLKFD